MIDSQAAIADRLARAADRMANSGFGDEERRFRNAVAQISAGLSLEEAQALEHLMLPALRPRMLNRLTALAAAGEYDGAEEGGGLISAAVPGDSPDLGVLTDMMSGAGQLLSTATSSGLSDPYSSAQDGWILSPQTVDPYTGEAATGSNVNGFTGVVVDSFTGSAPVDENTNAFTGGQNIDPFAGFQGASLLSSPYLLAVLDVPPTPSDEASDASGATSANAVGADGSPSIVYLDGYAYTPYVEAGAVVFDPGSTVENVPRKLFFPEMVVGPTDVPADDMQPVFTGPVPFTARLATQNQRGTTSSVATRSVATPSVATQPRMSQEQLDEQNWGAAKSGMRDSAVDLTYGLATVPMILLMPGFSLLGPPSFLDWAKAGPPAPTGNPVRDAELLDHYRTGVGITTVVSLAAPFGAEGMLDSALQASTKLPALEGMGMGGGGRLIGPTEQWLAGFNEPASSFGPEIQNTLNNGDAAHLQHVLRGGSGDRGIAVLHLDVSELTENQIRFIVDDMRDMDYQAGMAGGLQRTAVSSSSRYAANRVAALGRETLALSSTEAAGHLPDVAAGGSPLGPIAGTPRSVNSSIGGQWRRYAPGFTFDGFSLIDRSTGEFLYISGGLETEPALILDFSF